MKKSSVEVKEGQIWSTLLKVEFVILHVEPNHVVAKTRNLASGNKEILVHMAKFSSGELVFKGNQRGKRAAIYTATMGASANMLKTGRAPKEFTL